MKGGDNVTEKIKLDPVIHINNSGHEAEQEVPADSKLTKRPILSSMDLTIFQNNPRRRQNN